MTSARTADDWHWQVLGFWFGLTDEQHWRRDAELDAEIARRFEGLWQEQKGRAAEELAGSPEQALAAIILFDQFPRNMFRDDPRAFATDGLAQAVAKAAIERGYDRQIAPERRHFFYLPLEHSEELADQERCVELFERLGNDRYLEHARQHHDVIARFGRFPHRNAVLGRESSAEERAFGLEQPW